MVLYNCGHPKNVAALTPDTVSTQTSAFLHRFSWLDDDEIGEIPFAWNFLVCHNKVDPSTQPKAIHYSSGGPWFERYKNCDFTELWIKEAEELKADKEKEKQQQLIKANGGGEEEKKKEGNLSLATTARCARSPPSPAPTAARPHPRREGRGEIQNGTFGGITEEEEQSSLYNFLYPSKELLPDDKEMSIFDHLEELRDRIFVSVLAVGAAILACFAYSKDLIRILEAPVSVQGVRFLQLSPGEFFFTTLKVSGYCGLLLGSPVILYEIIAFVLPGLTRDERRFLGPIVLGSSVLFYLGIFFSYTVLAPAALNFFVNYAEGAVESLWSIDQYFEFVLVLLFSTGLSFQFLIQELYGNFSVVTITLLTFELVKSGKANQCGKFKATRQLHLMDKVPVIQLLLGQVGLVSSDQMLSIWRYVVVGAVVAAAVLTPSTDPLTQMLLAGPLLGLYLGGAWMVKLTGR
uniref:Sec-independent protein translocase protein TATC, chloroplastic n=1 Tax=Oryza brachyantha TaxID=4533 RepID=J3L0A3_ORYBR